MSDTSGPMYEMPLAQYDPAMRCWKTSEATSLWALPMSSLTLPAWGYLRDGALFEQPTPEHPTTGPGCSSLLATPTTMDTLPAREGEAYEKAKNYGGRKNRKATGNLREQAVYLPTPTASDYRSPNTNPGAQGGKVMPASEHSLPARIYQQFSKLPTPTAQAAKHTLDDRGPGTPDDANLWSVVGRLLPTPAVNDMGAGKDPEAWREWAARQKAADGRPAPHGKSLEQEAIGVSTRQQSHAGRTSSDDPHQPQLFTATSETD
jgi:hypothetical protein